MSVTNPALEPPEFVCKDASSSFPSATRRTFHPTQANYGSMLETTNSAVVCLAADGTILYWNKGAERVLGYADHDVVGRKYLELLVPREHWDATATHIQTALSGAVSRNFETPVVAQDGTPRVLISNASRLIDADGQTIGIFAIGHDITELKRAQAILVGGNRILEQLATQESLDAVLQLLVRTIQEVSSNLLCAVTLIDNGTERTIAAEEFPQSESPVGDALPAGTAGNESETWAEPIPTTSGAPLGSLVACLRLRGTPTEFESETVRAFARLAGIAIEHKRAQEERLRETEDRLRTAVDELEELRAQVREQFSFEEIVAVSPPMLKVLHLAAQVAPTDATVLITGETGTGKEVLARAIHTNSPRKNAPFVAVNCGAIPETLIESELFGHERGAFTGADRRKPGLVERANGGVLFLDEVGELPLQSQVKLLRVLQERVFERLGGTEPLNADVRIIAATNRDLAAEAESGKFREDLFYRLNVFHIHIPPLRERRQAIPVLAKKILQKIAARMRRPEIGLSKLALELLNKYEWKGNVRELENALERAAILCGGSLIRPEHLPIQAAAPAPFRTSNSRELVVRLAEGFSMEKLERQLIALALKQSGGNQSEAARLLGISRGTLRWRLQK